MNKSLQYGWIPHTHRLTEKGVNTIIEQICEGNACYLFISTFISLAVLLKLTDSVLFAAFFTYMKTYMHVSRCVCV